MLIFACFASFVASASSATNVESLEALPLPSFTISSETENSTVPRSNTSRDVSYNFSDTVQTQSKVVPHALLRSNASTLVFVSKVDAHNDSIPLLNFDNSLSIRVENGTAVCNATLSDGTNLVVRTPKIITTGWHHLLFEEKTNVNSTCFRVEVYVDGNMVAENETSVTPHCANTTNSCQEPERDGMLGPAQRANVSLRSFMKFDTALSQSLINQSYRNTDWFEKLTQNITLLVNLTDAKAARYNRNAKFWEKFRNTFHEALFLAFRNADDKLDLHKEDIAIISARLYNANVASASQNSRLRTYSLRNASRQLQFFTSGISLTMQYKVAVRQREQDRVRRLMESFAPHVAGDFSWNSLTSVPVFRPTFVQPKPVIYPEDRYFEEQIKKLNGGRSLRLTARSTIPSRKTTTPKESSETAEFLAQEQ